MAGISMGFVIQSLPTASSSTQSTELALRIWNCSSIYFWKP